MKGNESERDSLAYGWLVGEQNREQPFLKALGANSFSAVANGV